MRDELKNSDSLIFLLKKLLKDKSKDIWMKKKLKELRIKIFKIESKH